MIKVVIFDMDGVLLDSEPFWQEAEIEVFASVGIKLTREQCIETTGLPVKDVVSYRYQQNPWENKSQEQISDEIFSSVEQKVLQRAVLLDGVMDVLEMLDKLRIPKALASSSSMQLINTVLKKFSMEKTFDVVHSAEYEEYGKPHPAVFITTAGRMSVSPRNCLVIEDSFNGLIAAKAASMKTLVVPMAEQWNQKRFDIADCKLRTLKDFTEQQWDLINALP
ncbi:MAG: hexitol phosphatase HxpB [Bacteroidetes bacterium]|nr:hexitol phosphatase HxpB [Bacteroidota bacterium]